MRGSGVRIPLAAPNKTKAYLKTRLSCGEFVATGCGELSSENSSAARIVMIERATAKLLRNTWVLLSTSCFVGILTNVLIESATTHFGPERVTGISSSTVIV
jgi:hypothetical protein